MQYQNMFSQVCPGAQGQAELYRGEGQDIVCGDEGLLRHAFTQWYVIAQGRNIRTYVCMCISMFLWADNLLVQ